MQGELGAHVGRETSGKAESEREREEGMEEENMKTIGMTYHKL